MSAQTKVAPGVQDRLNELQAERDRTWPLEQREAQQTLRDSLEANLDRERLIKVGDRLPQARLPEVDGGEVDLDELRSQGPLVLVFFRWQGCPACNAALPGYQELLLPALRELNAQLVFVSPQSPDRLVEIKRRHDFDIPVVSDVGAVLIDELGIGFAPPEEERAGMRAEDKDVGELLGTGSWTLPYPTVIVADTEGVVRFVDTHPDWMTRTEVDPILAAVGLAT